MKKTLNKSSNLSQLSTFFELSASCGCGPCGCVCSGNAAYVTPNANLQNIEAGYRNSLSAHS